MSDSKDELYSSSDSEDELDSDIDDVSEYRDMCDACVQHRTGFCGAVTTRWKAEDLIRYRDMAESVLKDYNKSELTNFKLLEVCKVNLVVTYFCLTFRAQEDGSQERPLFRGVFRLLTNRVVFVEMKEDEEVTLPADSDDDKITFPAVVDDSVCSKVSYESVDDRINSEGPYENDEDRSSSLRKIVYGDGAKADSCGVKTGSSDVGVISTFFKGRVGSEKKKRKTNHGKNVLGDGSKADPGGVKHGRTDSPTTFKECVRSKKKRGKTIRGKICPWRRLL